ncbi:MAG: DUF2867 domain-containing protein, partial [Stackebrandtia sp.]
VVTGRQLNNVHERIVAGPLASSSELLETLLDPETSVWPFDLRHLELDRGLEPGSTGGHGPVRYTVVEHEVGRRVRFEFTPEAPIAGWHEFVLGDVPGEGVRWRHELFVDPVDDRIREHLEPSHDELVEILLDRVETRLGTRS